MSNERKGDVDDTQHDPDPRDEADARLRVVVQGMPVMMDAFDEHRLLTVWNAECERVTGYKAEEVVGNPDAMSILYPDPEYRARMIREWTERGDDYRNWTWEITCKDGSKRMIEWSNVSKHFPISGWTTWGIGVDVTERLNLEAKLRQSQKMDAIGQLAGGVAHDFNNLLMVINGCGREILEGLPADETTIRYLAGAILDAGERAAMLTRQLLLFSRRAPLQPTMVDINALVRGCSRLLDRLIGENVRVRLDLAEDLEKVYADAGQTEQVVVNLCLNARDAMRAGGLLVIGTANVEFRDADLAGRAEIRAGRFVQISVADNGVGMSDEVKAHLFEPFFTTKAVGSGTGLGLATVFGIVQEQKGFLTVESAPGAGTTMRVFLPEVQFDPQSEPAPRTPRTSMPIGSGTETVLVVEDDAVARRVLARWLRASGYRVLEAGSGNEAVRLVENRADTLDLLLTDLTMPGMSGRQTATVLRMLRPTLRLLFMTGYSADTWSRDAAEPGGEVLQKPFTMTDLLAKIRATLDRR